VTVNGEKSAHTRKNMGDALTVPNALKLNQPDGGYRRQCDLPVQSGNTH